MAGLEVLYTCVGGSISCPQDAILCFVHWEMIKRGYKCVGSGDTACDSDKRSELLPADWNSNKELYSLRYQGNDSNGHILLKAITADSSLIFNLMNSSTQQVSDLNVNISDYVDSNHLHTIDNVFRDAAGLADKVKTHLLPTVGGANDCRGPRTTRREEERQRGEDSDPLRMPFRQPHRQPFHQPFLQPHPGTQQPWPDPMNPPFGRVDLDPLGSHGVGGMIVDPLRSGYPRSDFDPSSGIPDILPPGAVPPGARFDPFGPWPDPDHMPPPGYDDMFM